MLHIIGVDEAGRGALAGPVIAAAVLFSAQCDPSYYQDSKSISAKKREQLFSQLYASNALIGVGSVDQYIIDRINILQASLLAMKKAIISLQKQLKNGSDWAFQNIEVLIDGNQMVKGLTLPARTIIKGDKLIPAISAASIVAKVTRDRIMCRAVKQYPEYGFEVHKGYATKRHYEAILTHGQCDLHRKTFQIRIKNEHFDGK